MVDGAIKLEFYPWCTEKQKPDSFYCNIVMKKYPETGNRYLYQVYYNPGTLSWCALYNFPNRLEKHKMRWFRKEEEAKMFCKLLFDDVLEFMDTDNLEVEDEFANERKNESYCIQKYGLPCPYIMYHYSKGKKGFLLTESKVEKEKNNGKLELYEGPILCRTEVDAEILSRHGWECKKEENKRLVKHLPTDFEKKIESRQFWICTRK